MTNITKSLVISATLGKGKLSRRRKRRKVNPGGRSKIDNYITHKEPEELLAERKAKKKSGLPPVVTKVEKITPGISIPAKVNFIQLDSDDSVDIMTAARGLNTENEFMNELDAIATMGDTIGIMLNKIKNGSKTNKNHERIVKCLDRIRKDCKKIEELY